MGEVKYMYRAKHKFCHLWEQIYGQLYCIDLKKSTLTTRALKLNKNTMTIHILIGDIDLYDTGFREEKKTVNNVFGDVLVSLPVHRMSA